MSLSNLADEIYENGKLSGWYQTEPKVIEQIALMHCELSEAIEEYRDGHSLDEIYFNSDKPGKPEGILVELADVAIRLLGFIGHINDYYDYGIDFDQVVRTKMEYNKTRGYRHGNKKI